MLEDVVTKVQEMLPLSRPVVVGVSGGADSMVLLDILDRAGLPLLIAHVNFHLRGEESNRDEEFVRKVVDRKYLRHRFFVRGYYTESYAERQGISTEMAARELRYAFFNEIAEQFHASTIAVGHNADDQVETLLLNIARGTGGKGLVGMDFFIHGILRPLIQTSRKEIEMYLEAHQIPHVEDSTNSKLIYHRNILRHKVIPTLERLNPSFRTTALESMRIFAQEQALIDSVITDFHARRWDKKIRCLSLAGIEEESHAELLLFRLLQPLGFSSQQVADILSDTTRSGKQFQSHTNTEQELELFRGNLYFYSYTEPFSPMSIRYRGEYELDDLGILQVGGWFGKLRIDRNAVSKDAVLRPARREDFFAPFGMEKGKKRLFDFLKEQGIPSAYRPHCPVIADGEMILAVPPLQVSHDARVTDGTPLYLSFAPGDHPLGHLLHHLSEEK